MPPTSTPPDFEQWLAILRARENRLLAYQTAFLTGLSGPLKAKLTLIFAELTRRYVMGVGSVYQRDVDSQKVGDVGTWLDGQLAALDVSTTAAQIQAASVKPYVIGAVAAAALVGLSQSPKNVTPKVTDDAVRASIEAQSKAATRLDQAREIVRSSKRWGDFTLGMAKANQSVSALNNGGSWAIHRSASMGSADFASHGAGSSLHFSDLTTIWVCQPGACPICLPHNGQEITLDYPPAHFHCRCQPGLATRDLAPVARDAVLAGAYQNLAA